MTQQIEARARRAPGNTNGCLVIAGLHVALECGDRDLAKKIQGRYAGFFRLGVPQSHVQVTVRPVPDDKGGKSTGWEVPEGQFSGGELRLSSPGLQGRIADEGASTHLTLASAFPIEDLDYFLRAVIALLAFEAGGMLFHAAGILKNNRAFLFFGPSGSGKSTVARLSTGTSLLNDDLVVLMPETGGWTAHATPFWNPTQTRPAEALAGDLAGLFKLVQDNEVYTAPLIGGQALASLLASIPILTADPARVEPLMQRCDALLEAAPCFELHFRKAPDFWEVVDRAVS